MKVYLAGPMTGLPALNHPTFHDAAGRLRARGIEVVNPAEIVKDQGMAWADCMRRDIPELVSCEAIVLLPCWDALARRTPGIHHRDRSRHAVLAVRHES